MAAYKKTKIDPNWSAEKIWTAIRDAVAVAGCAEIRPDPAGNGTLILVTWFDEHVNWTEHQEIF
jgi:hypothetical protein